MLIGLRLLEVWVWIKVVPDDLVPLGGLFDELPGSFLGRATGARGFWVSGNHRAVVRVAAGAHLNSSGPFWRHLEDTDCGLD